jgi:hypothetical protein
MSDASNLKAPQDQLVTEECAVEALQAEYRKALDKLRALLQREVALQKLWAELDGDAHPFE